MPSWRNAIRPALRRYGGSLRRSASHSIKRSAALATAARRIAGSARTSPLSSSHGKTIALDVRATNTLSASAVAAGAADAHVAAQEGQKRAKHAADNHNFKPYVMDLDGAVPERSYG